MEGYIFRFVSLLGERYSHGHVIDFYEQLEQHPEFLQVLGDGTQRKSYMYVQDCIDAMFTVIERRPSRVYIQSRNRGVLHGQRIHSVYLRHPRRPARTSVYGWFAGVDRRQPVYLPR